MIFYNFNLRYEIFYLFIIVILGYEIFVRNIYIYILYMIDFSDLVVYECCILNLVCNFFYKRFYYNIKME